MGEDMLLSIAKALGLVRLARYRLRRSVIILTLHGVLDESIPLVWRPLWPRLPLSVLDRLAGELARHYSFVSLPDAAAMLRGDAPFRERCIVFTFDDGYRNNATRALPVLRRYGIKPAFFVATSAVSRQTPFAVDRLDFVIQRLAAQQAEVTAGRQTVRLRADDRAGQRVALDTLLTSVRRSGAPINDPAFEPLLESLEDRAGERLRDPHDEVAGVLGWDELRDLSRGGLADIGSHTVNHALLGTVPAATALAELSESKATIEHELGRSCLTFCYPATNVAAETPHLVKQAGYACAVMNRGGRNIRGCDPYLLGRIGVPPEATFARLVSRISGLSEVFALRGATGTSTGRGGPVSPPQRVASETA